MGSRKLRERVRESKFCSTGTAFDTRVFDTAHLGKVKVNQNVKPSKVKLVVLQAVLLSTFHGSKVFTFLFLHLPGKVKQ